MKSVLISIQPKWCELIASGKKTVEVRKTKPKIDTPFKCYIYCTEGDALAYPCINNPRFSIHKMITSHSLYGRRLTKKEREESDYTFANGKVIGEFLCKSIANYEAELWDDETYERIQEFFEPDDFAEYGEYEYKTVADNGDDFWRDNMLCHYSCLTIEELRKYIGSGINEFYGWNISDLVIYDKPKDLDCFRKPIDCHRGIDRENCKGCWDCEIKRPPQSWCYVESEGTE